jgi:zinc/manganese transport system substrate-binding protein/zinc transport system substrate-binding protein
VSALADLIKREQVKVILMEPYHERSIPDLLARQTGAAVLVLAPTVGGTPGTDDYVALFDTDVARLAEALGAGRQVAK